MAVGRVLPWDGAVDGVQVRSDAISASVRWTWTVALPPAMLDTVVAAD